MPRSLKHLWPIYAWLFFPSVSHWLAAPTAGVNATVTQSMRVMAFFLSNTTIGGTASDGTTTTSATAAGDAVIPHSPTVTAIYVSGVAELTVEL